MMPLSTPISYFAWIEMKNNIEKMSLNFFASSQSATQQKPQIEFFFVPQVVWFLQTSS